MTLGFGNTTAAEIRPVYLIFGSAGRLRSEAVLRLRSIIAGEGNEWNYVELDCESISADDILTHLNTPPFLGSRRMVLAKGADRLRPADSEALIQMIGRIPDFSVFVMTAESIDKRSKLFKAISKFGETLEFGKLPQTETLEWVRKRAAQLGLGLDRAKCSLLAALTGGDLDRLAGELDKLAIYASGSSPGSLTESEIREVIAAWDAASEYAVFELVDAIVWGRVADGLRLLGTLLQNSEPPLKILFMIGRQYRLILETMDLVPGATPKRVAAELGIKEYPARKLIEQATRVPQHKAERALQLVLGADRALKRSGSEPRVVLEVLLTNLAV